MNFTFFRLNVKRVFFYYFLSLAYVDLQEGEKTHTCVCGGVCVFWLWIYSPCCGMRLSLVVRKCLKCTLTPNRRPSWSATASRRLNCESCCTTSRPTTTSTCTSFHWITKLRGAAWRERTCSPTSSRTCRTNPSTTANTRWPSRYGRTTRCWPSSKKQGESRLFRVLKRVRECGVKSDYCKPDWVSDLSRSCISTHVFNVTFYVCVCFFFYFFLY